MNNYNVKLYTYANDVQQMRVYKRPVLTGAAVSNSVEKRKATLADETRVRTEKDIARSEWVSVKNTKQKIYEIARSNNWDYMVTFTFNPQRVMRDNYEEITRVMKKWLYQIKKEKAPDMAYIIIPELHADKKNFHFHGLLKNIGNIRLTDSGHKHGDKTVYNIADFKWGFTDVTQVVDNSKVCSYITKYITKDLCAVTKGKKRYWCSRNAERPDIKDYNLPHEEIDDIVDSLEYNIDYVKTIDIPVAYQSIKYIEIKGGENHGNAV